MKISRKQKRTRGNADLDYKAQERFLMEVAKRTAVARMLVEETKLQGMRDSLVILQTLKQLADEENLKGTK